MSYLQHETGPAQQPSMRRSCGFCRSRKIRCSGQNICSACRERNIDCVYGREGSKGRPRGVTSKIATRGTSQKVENATAVQNMQTHPTPSPIVDPSLNNSSTPAPPQTNHAFRTKKRARTEDVDLASKHTIAADLQQIFGRLFDTQGFDDIETCPNAISALGRKNSENQTSIQSGDTSARPAITYEEPMRVLIKDYVEMVALQFGDLGCDQVENDGLRLFKRCLAMDDTQNMFDHPTEAPNPLLEYNDHQTLQMIDVWFSHHPLAVIISKTLLLRSCRDGAHDNILLAVILADVKFAENNSEARDKGTEIFRWAYSRLFDISNTNVDLVTVQALTLLGWYELCAARVRRSICYFLHASNLVTSLQAPTIRLNQINGMDIGEVEAELARSIRWITFSVILWAFMQMDAPIMELLPSSSSTSFPPINETSSSVFALDSASDNISTLPHQARTIRDLWPISHVASTTAHIYALYPRKQILAEPSKRVSWHTHTLRQLQRLSSPLQNTPEDVSNLCSRVRHVLVGALDLFEPHAGCETSQSTVLSAYHTMIVHFLFPRSPDLSGSRPVTVGLIEDVCRSARALLQVSSALERPQDCGRMTMGLCPCTIAEVFVLGLDACGRAFAYFQSRTRLSVEPEASLISAKYEELSSLASNLRVLSKHENLRQTKRTQAMKKQLKQVVQTFDNLSPRNSQMFDFSTNDSFLTGDYPILNRAPDFNPGLRHSLTDSASSTVSRESSTNDIMFPPFGRFSQKELDDVSTSALTPFLNPEGVGIDWAGTDMIGFGGTGPAIAGDFSGYEFPEIGVGKVDTEAGRDTFSGDHASRGRGGHFGASAFRS
ncbi:MAG: hypothetical protein ALECFALPRED_009962 [Alectoria fallacina]|uniref:Zn(2)-C6 fungal-type domain-containing protein n=1 Tax=Alectoria fallacina TaxID=1903189 RepID=A0A8H3IGN3_9LECA|nr:MAG: hypothetical protein ALECFALPRED_009962 [Alectoria fallacina]